MDSPRESQGTSILTSLFSHQLQASIVYKYSFLSRSLEAWNKLNNDVIEATTTERFSKRAVSEIDFDLKLPQRAFVIGCLVRVQRLPRASWSMHFGDVSETNGRKTRSDHVPRNASAARNNEV